MTHRLRRPLLGFALPVALALLAADASGGTPANEGAETVDAPSGLPHTTPLDRAPKLLTFKLGDGAPLSLLRAYFDAEVERPGPYNRYVGGQYGRWSKQPWVSLAWGEDDRDEDSTVITGSAGDAASAHEGAADVTTWNPAIAVTRDMSFLERGLHLAVDDAPGAADASPEAFRFAPPPVDSLRVSIRPDDWITRLFVADDRPPFWTTGPSLSSNGFDGLWAASAKPANDWRCRRRPVLFVRFAGENDRISLVQCSGAVEPGAVDRLSILARPPEVPDPGELPDEPDPDAWEKGGEWLPRVKLVNPRLLWLLQKIADAFPHRAVYVYSGYRPHKDKSVLQGHHSMHGDGRAMDIQVYGVRNEALFQFCRKLEDVGCGLYPNSKFVHVDVRRPGTGHAFWIDTSGPGEPSRYVDSWPGVVEHGALAWMQVPKKEALPQGQRPRTPDERGTADVIRK